MNSQWQDGRCCSFRWRLDRRGWWFLHSPSPRRAGEAQEGAEPTQPAQTWLGGAGTAWGRHTLPAIRRWRQLAGTAVSLRLEHRVPGCSVLATGWPLRTQAEPGGLGLGS